MSQEPPVTTVRFDNKWLLRASWVAYAVPLGWFGVMLYTVYLVPEFWPGAGILDDVTLAWQASHAEIPLWITLALIFIYYLHLCRYRYRISLGAYVALIALWSNASIAAFVFLDWQTGIYVLLGSGTLVLFSVSWSQTIATFVEIKSTAGIIALFVLALLFPLSVVTLPAALILAYLNIHPQDTLIWIASLGGIVCSAAVLIPFWVLTRRARRGARAFLSQHGVA